MSHESSMASSGSPFSCFTKFKSLPFFWNKCWNNFVLLYLKWILAKPFSNKNSRICFIDQWKSLALPPTPGSAGNCLGLRCFSLTILILVTHLFFLNPDFTKMLESFVESIDITAESAVSRWFEGYTTCYTFRENPDEFPDTLYYSQYVL